ncbi:MAG: hypothetical protein GMKNLPBB_01798 [Myxococcota bacterium]|nr:hypothetical protein [Myxococcota bacterium]
MALRPDLYKVRNRPWPQPCPLFPDSFPAAVLNVPLREEADFAMNVGKRYAKIMSGAWARGLAWVARNPYPVSLTDDELTSLLLDTAIIRTVSDRLDPKDEPLFGEFVKSAPAGARFWKADYSAQSVLKLLPGMYAAPTIGLLRLDSGGKRSLAAIAVNNLVLRPEDGHAWRLAKFFLQQSFSQHITTCHHVALHFYFDTVNAVTKSLLPKDHPIRQLLTPHFRWSLALSESALYSGASVLSNRRIFPYTPFGAESSSIYLQTTFGCIGIEGNSCYPKYQWPEGETAILGEYGHYLRHFYRAILPFTSVVADMVPRHDSHVRLWADHIAEWVPGFPDGSRILEPGRLAHALAHTVWGTTVAHAADHYGLGVIAIGKLPYRLRLPPPASRDIPAFKDSDLCNKEDAFRHYLCWELFLRETTISRLVDVKYDFAPGAAAEAGKRFPQDLRAANASLPTREFIPLERISVSIQF